MAASGGLIWTHDWGQWETTLLNQDVNATLWGGSTAYNLRPLVTLLLSDGSALTDITWLGNGLFSDPNGLSYVVPGTNPGDMGFFRVQVWAGNYNSYAAALAAGFPWWGNPNAPDVLTGQTPVFANPVGSFLAPTFLDNMPALIMIPVPEPGAFVLAALGAMVFCLIRRNIGALEAPLYSYGLADRPSLRVGVLVNGNHPVRNAASDPANSASAMYSCPGPPWVPQQ